MGGSVSTTALNIAAGARSRWASIFAGLWMLLILLALSQAVGLVPMPTLAAVLIFAAVMSLRFGDIGVVWKTSHTGKIGMVVTFVSTLALPVAAAVGVGLICSLVLQLNKEQMDLRVVRLIRNEDGDVVEQPVPTTLPDAEPVVLDVYGSLLYAGAQDAGRQLPDPARPNRPVVILRLRGRTSLGSTFFGVIAGYADALEAAGGRLYLSGVQPGNGRSVPPQPGAGRPGQDQDLPRHRGARRFDPAAVQDARTWLVGAAQDGGPTTRPRTGTGQTPPAPPAAP